MRLPKRGERGFTLIELLIVVAILGVLAAVIIPNVQRFIGAGEQEAIDTEFANVQAAVSAMMVDNQLPTLPTPVDVQTNATNDMGAFPDFTTVRPQLGGEVYGRDGYLLYGHEMAYDDLPVGALDGIVDTIHLVNYVAQQHTAYFYTTSVNGTITQWNAAKTEQLNPPPLP